MIYSFFSHLSSFLDNHNQLAKKPKQKLSLDGHYNSNQNYQNPNFLSHYPSNQQNKFHGLRKTEKPKKTSHNGKEFTDSFSEDSNDEDDDESELGLTDEKMMNHYKKGGAAPSIISSELDTTTFFDTENDDDGQLVFSF